MGVGKHHGLPCVYCHRPMNRREEHMRPTRDHFIPQSQGGREIVVCCSTCNTIKADMLPDQWLAFMEANPRWWLMTKVELRAARRRAFIVTPGMRLRKVHRQGSPPAKPVIVPPELIFFPEPAE